MLRLQLIKEKAISNKKKMNKILLLRHGGSIWNNDSKFTGWTNIPLTKKGREEASLMSECLLFNDLYPNVIFSSVLERAVETSNIINDNLFSGVIPIYTSWRLNERHYGQLEGISRKYVRDIYGNKIIKSFTTDYRVRPPNNIHHNFVNKYPVYTVGYHNHKKMKNGESIKDVSERLLPYYENDILHTLTENKLPLIVTHQNTARILMKHLLKISDDDFEDYELPSKKMFYISLDDNYEYETHEEIHY
jgi:2,3-bisphosphoglycerate-dependent phosphoglycerate mutase